ncbi:asparagine synthase (glutamine-hydrolyzing) [Cellulomonas iranensis]|uniref:asparagine synthase (glutamine-hydrolyzing) n=1 Tax=Cellulomonas iranensis TaxID=76862 RepID=A0ABU0GH09_9CELL|nr:asparagine synthase (glutamine-hydrolyzing) [Cellulomonas iranensis]MDQ0424649.1 asparagine synthase (glutamine-hydrolyzing) [Cellulomonas iranensis]
MCGIAGVYETRGVPFTDETTLKAMTTCLLHRGPDETGYHVDGAVGLGFTRLSVIDVPHGHQPMVDDATGVALVFNGEIYNYRELRSRLEASGHRFLTESDTESVLRGYLQWGDGVVDHLTGMFAIAVHDPRTRTLTLARDHLGIKPLYWTRVGDRVVFGSEMKSLFAHPGFERRAHLPGISSYLTFRQAVWDVPYLEGVRKVLPGHVVQFDARGARERAFWELPVPEVDETRSREEWLDLADEMLLRSVRRCMVSEVPLGAYLSGGLDSSLVVAMMSRFADRPVRTFSVGYGDGAYDEGRYAQAVADVVGAEHEHLVMGPAEYRAGLVPLIVQRDAPLSIPQEIAVLELSRRMRGSVTVALCGDGADELFGGYGRVMRSPLDWAKIRALRAVLPDRWSEAIARSRPRRQTDVLSQIDARTHLEHFYRMYHWVPFEEKAELFTPDVRAALQDDRATRRPFEESFARTADVDPYDAVLHAFQHLHIGAILDKVDAVGMAASLEGRVPFVDHELVETFVRMPRRFKMPWRGTAARLRSVVTPAFEASEKLDTSKALLRDVAARYLPRELTTRKKMGFPTPLDDWMRDGMLDEARAVLLDPSVARRGIFDVTAMERFLARPQDLDHDFYGKKVWMYLNVELWLRNVVEA